jgi:predicted MFS family arabinose efflux permease
MAVAILAGLAEPARVHAPRKRLVAEIQEGAAFVWRHALLRPILITAVIYNASWFVLQAVYVAYAVRTLSLSAVEVGLTLAIYGVGMVAGALAAPAIARRVTVGAMIAAGPTSALIAALLIAATLAVPSVFLVAAAFFLFGAGPILWTITTTTLRQSVTPGAMLGRVSALILTATFGARPVGAAIAAVIASVYGAEACLVLVAAGFAAQFVVLLASPVRRLTVMPTSAQDDAALVRT